MEEIMTPSEVANLLKIHLKTVYKLAEKGVIPGNRIGRSWRFSRSDVLELVSSKPINLSDSDTDDQHQDVGDDPAAGVGVCGATVGGQLCTADRHHPAAVAALIGLGIGVVWVIAGLLNFHVLR